MLIRPDELDRVLAVSDAAPDARIVAVHMEAFDHGLESRSALSGRLEPAGVANRVHVPADGENLSS